MDKKLIIANWKSHKKISEAEEFIISISKDINRINLENKEIVIAPSYHLLYVCKNLIEKYNLPIELSAQDVSPFPQGAFTGEVSAAQIKDICKMTIIGHSERRELFSESDEILLKKVNEAKAIGLKMVYCIQNESQKIPTGVDTVAYEPPTAIGTGAPDDPSHIERVFRIVKENFSGRVLYGGSIEPDNVRNYIHIDACDGLLVGGASLDADSFISLLSQW